MGESQREIKPRSKRQVKVEETKETKMKHKRRRSYIRISSTFQLLKNLIWVWSLIKLETQLATAISQEVSFYVQLTTIFIVLFNLATLNQIIKESLPADVRAQKETMDLICFIANAFVDLLSDTSNNVCYSQQKKNIIPEHLIRALQELHLDHYLPFLLDEDQNQTLADILKHERK